jgi:Protein of unknown function (DUF4239)
MIDKWLTLPLSELVFLLVIFYFFSAASLVFLCFNSLTRDWIKGFTGITAAFYSGIIPFLGILVGFLANDVWDSNRRANEVVSVEAANLTTLYGMVAISDLSYVEISHAIRIYVSTVVDKEWQTMQRGEASPEAEIAQDQLLRIVAHTQAVGDGESNFRRLLIDVAMKIREARSDRIKLSTDNSENLKWISVLFLTVIGQISIAAVHLDRIRPQIAALTIFTSAVVVLLCLIASHELPFTPPLSISSEPIARLLTIVPEG